MIDIQLSLGLGVMGYPMAKNLRAGLSPDKTLLICDVNVDAMGCFKTEMEGKGPVETISNAFEAAKAAVRHLINPAINL